MIGFLPPLLLGLAAGAVLVLLASWGPLRIVDEDARWQAALLDMPPAPPAATWRATWADVRRSGVRNVVLVLGAVAVAVWALVARNAEPIALVRLPFLWGLLVLGAIDWRTRLLPDAIVLPLLWLGFLIQIVLERTTVANEAVGLAPAVLGGIAGYLMMWVPARAYRLWRGIDAMGAGDMKLLAMVGAWLGPQPLLPIVLAAVLMGAGWQGAALARGRGDWREEFALGPWIVLAALVAAAPG